MISVLLPIYNGEDYLEKSINSVLEQTFKDFELLIGFNGTLDNSKNIVKKYNDTRIKIFDYGDDKGKAKTLNKLIKETKYDILALQDHDDIWVNNKLEKQLKYINDYDIIGSFISYIDENGDHIGSPNISIEHKDIIYKSLNGDNNIANTSAIFKKESAILVNGWSESIDGIEDFDFWLKLIKTDKKFFNIPEKLVLHRVHKNSNFNNNKYDLNKIL